MARPVSDQCPKWAVVLGRNDKKAASTSGRETGGGGGCAKYIGFVGNEIEEELFFTPHPHHTTSLNSEVICEWEQQELFTRSKCFVPHTGALGLERHQSER